MALNASLELGAVGRVDETTRGRGGGRNGESRGVNCDLQGILAAARTGGIDGDAGCNEKRYGRQSRDDGDIAALVAQKPVAL